MKRKTLISPSILSADFSQLKNDVKKVVDAGADLIHVDVMDGHFVPNITMGPLVVKALKKHIQIPFDVHLMIENPEKYIEDFVEAGSDIITFHIEAVEDPGQMIDQIKSHGIKAGISVKPKTPIDGLENIIDKLDLILIMTVEPGFGGQSFMPDMMTKITNLRKIYSGHISVDGGINGETAKIAKTAGADILVAGTAIFGSDDYSRAISKLR